MLISHGEPVAICSWDICPADVTDISVVNDFQTKLPLKVIQVSDISKTMRKEVSGIAREFQSLVITDKRIPIMSQVKLLVCLTGVTLVDAD